MNLSFLDPILSPYLSHVSLESNYEIHYIVCIERHVDLSVFSSLSQFGSHGLSVAQIGFIFLIPSGLYAILSPATGWIGDKTVS